MTLNLLDIHRGTKAGQRRGNEGTATWRRPIHYRAGKAKQITSANFSERTHARFYTAAFVFSRFLSWLTEGWLLMCCREIAGGGGGGGGGAPWRWGKVYFGKCLFSCIIFIPTRLFRRPKAIRGRQLTFSGARVDVHKTTGATLVVDLNPHQRIHHQPNDKPNHKYHQEYCWFIFYLFIFFTFSQYHTFWGDEK